MGSKGKKSVLPSREEELKGQLARALADYDNLRKRTELEREEIIKLSLFGFFEKLAPIIDNLRKAQMHLKDEGLEHILADLEKILSEEGIEKIEAEGRVFDENLHEAIEIEPADDEAKEGIISEVLQMGWRFKDGPVIRPAKVKVYKIKQ
jgi:molecular chaperone GrpE